MLLVQVWEPLDDRTTHSLASCGLKIFSGKKKKRERESKVKTYELILKWFSDLGHFNFKSEWRLWELNIFTKQTQMLQIGHPNSEAASDPFCSYFLYELLNCYELPIHLQASILSLKDCIIQKRPYNTEN